MSASHSLKLRRLFGLLLLLFALCVEARTQIKFVQITDPHLFDEGAEATGNRDALTACVKKINERVDGGNVYQFVIVTGDIGVEKIVEGLISQKGAATAKEREAIEKAIGKGVGVLSSIISSSKVRRWLFIPGNNDLYQENPASIGYYHQFIEQLASALTPIGIEVRDLCPKADNPSAEPYAKSAVYVNGPYAFIGFNNASFKNNDDSRSLLPSAGVTGGLGPDELKRVQGTYVEQVRSLMDSTLDGKKISFAYILYHIPEVDDPYLISGNEAKDEKLKKKLDARQKAVEARVIDEPTRYSSWLVHRDVRDKWYSLINDGSSSGKLAGLFAGHLHDWKRETYQNYHWLKTAGYPSVSLTKLYLCPPLAVKLQGDQPDQARGFMEVLIDSQGRVLDEWGRSGARIFWYNPVSKSFTGDENEKETEWLGQLALGRILEDSGRLDEAEAAYTKALGSKSPVTRRNASESIQRVAEKRVFPLNRYFFTPWGFSLSIEGIGLLISLSLLLTLSAVWLGEKQLKDVLSLVDRIVLAASFVLLICALSMAMMSVAIAAGLLVILLAVWLARKYSRIKVATAYLIILAVALIAPVIVPSPPMKGMLILAGLLFIWFGMWLAARRLKDATSIAYFITLAAGFVALVFLLWLAGNLMFANGMSISPRKAISLMVVAAILDIWLLSLVMKRQGKNVLVVNPLVDTTQHKIGATFPHVLFQRRNDIIALRNPPPGALSKDPISLVWGEEETEFADLIGSVVPGGFGKIVSWLVRKASQPQYYLRGSLQPAGADLMIIIIVESAGRKPKSWSRPLAVGDLLAVEVELAHKVLMYVENPELYGNET